MVDEGPTEVGSIVGILRIDDSQWNTTLDRAEAKSKQLGRSSPTIKVNTEGVPQAIAALQALKAQEDRVARGGDDMAKSVKDANDKALRPLLTTALLLGPALIPLAIGGAAFAGGLVAGAGALFLAFKGIGNELGSATSEAATYGVGLRALTADLAKLESSAASGFLVPFNHAVSDANSLVPALSSQVREFAGVTGDAAEHLTHGLITGFMTLRPLLTDVINYVDQGAIAFDNWAGTTGGITRFMNVAQTDLPIIGHDLGELVTAVVRVGGAFGSSGLFALNTLGLISRLINAIPVDKLNQVAVVATVMFAAFKGYQILNLAKDGFDKLSSSISSAIDFASKDTLMLKANADAMQLAAARGATFAVATDGVSTALATQRTEAEAASVATQSAARANTALGLSADAMLGPLGLLAAGIGLVAFTFLGGHSANQQAVADIRDYTQALKDDNGVLAAHTRQQVADKLVSIGAIDLAKKLHISTGDLTSSLVDGGKASGDLRDHLKTLIDAGKDYSAQIGVNTRGLTQNQMQLGATSKDAQALLNILNDQSGELASATAKVHDLQQTYAALGLTLDGTSIAVGTGSVQWDVYNAMQANAAGAAMTNAQSIAQTTLNLQAENDAAGLVTQAFKMLDGNALDLAQAQTALDAATLQAITTLKTNKGSMDEHTQAGIADRQAIEGVAKQLENKAIAEAQATNSTKQATADYKTNADALLAQIGKLDGTTSAAYKYAQQLLQVPKFVETDVELKADQAAADLANFQKRIDALHGKDLNITVNGAIVPASVVMTPGGGLKKLAGGGPVNGPGAIGVDSVPAMLAPGEWVVSAADRRRPGVEQFLRGLQSGVAAPMIGSPAASSVSASYSSAGTNGTSGDGALLAEVQALRATVDQQTLALSAVIGAAAAGNRLAAASVPRRATT